eukprot:COSAG01_NODE_16892_length_1195_cov_18.305657_2_plen_79_part_00
MAAEDHDSQSHGGCWLSLRRGFGDGRLYKVAGGEEGAEGEGGRVSGLEGAVGHYWARTVQHTNSIPSGSFLKALNHFS